MSGRLRWRDLLLPPRGDDHPDPLGRQGLRFRVFVLCAAGALVPALAVALLSWWHLGRVDDRLLHVRQDLARAVAEHLDEEITADLETLQRLASSPLLTLDPPRPDASRALVRSTYLHSPFVGGLFVLDGRGQPVAEEPGGDRAIAPPPHLAEVQATLRDGKPRVTGLYRGGGGEPRTYALVAVTDWRNRVVGVVGGLLDPSLPLRARALRHLPQQGSAGYADLVDAGGEVLASTDRGRLRHLAPCHTRLAGLVARKTPDAGSCRSCHPDGSPWVMVFAPLAAAPWGVSLVEPEEALLATSGSLPAHFGLFALGLLAVAGLFAWGAARSVTRPVAVLTAASERIAAGALDERIPALGQDELGRLGQSVERMRASLRALIASEARANEELERRVASRTTELAEVNARLRERDAQRRRLLRTVITAQEDERKRIARELHDETTQSLAVLVMGLETAARALQEGGPQPRLEEVKALAVRTLEEVHRIILDLRPAVLDDLGLFAALRWYAERYLGGRGIAVRCEIGELERAPPPEVAIALFRIGQEAMNNVARHARAESVLIQLSADEHEITIEIEDDGQGFDPAAQPDDRPHYGLLGIRERAELLGGAAVIESAPGGGTRVQVRVPLPEPEPAPAPPLPAAAAAGPG